MADLNVQDFGKIYVLELDDVMEIMFGITIFVFLVNLPLHFQCGKRLSLGTDDTHSSGHLVLIRYAVQPHVEHRPGPGTRGSSHIDSGYAANINVAINKLRDRLGTAAAAPLARDFDKHIKCFQPALNVFELPNRLIFPAVARTLTFYSIPQRRMHCASFS